MPFLVLALIPVFILGIFVYRISINRNKVYKNFYSNFGFSLASFQTSKPEEEKFKFEIFSDFLVEKNIRSIFEVYKSKLSEDIRFEMSIPNFVFPVVKSKFLEIWPNIKIIDFPESGLHLENDSTVGGEFSFPKNESFGGFLGLVFSSLKEVPFGAGFVFQAITNPHEGLNLDAHVRMLIFSSDKVENEHMFDNFNDKFKENFKSSGIRFLKTRNSEDLKSKIISRQNSASSFLSSRDFSNIFNFSLGEKEKVYKKLKISNLLNKSKTKNSAISISSRKSLVLGSDPESMSDFIATLTLSDIHAGKNVIFLEKGLPVIEKIISNFPKEKANDLIILDQKDAFKILKLKNLKLEGNDYKVAVFSPHNFNKEKFIPKQTKIYAGLISEFNTRLIEEILAKNFFNNIEVVLASNKLSVFNPSIKNLLKLKIGTTAFLKLDKEEMQKIESELPEIINSNFMENLSENTAMLNNFETELPLFETGDLRLVKFSRIIKNVSEIKKMETYSNLVYWSNKKHIDEIISKLV
ncbi:MAG: hypothetical protein EXS49_00135 [Candidatus Pacebacteria bacterium]|nr:hypothetical protein [Candidatus Paceibacterota bacterium]